ncbi:two-component regulator propeller domain-containing protein [Pleionea sp. CnH1-48]|uniref:two-component regulator propeller domain-containing protein n=1 Tax=Pleionea sp. CnH1-48 TaxID=2954494 RepID=UPI0020977130|nr:two-component regulator propeller domain-containing protein [Pleionea sp. CnH1-48]MCO7226643.1 ATP-binding protein [Pleionea sp. CnH1-48]
MLNFRFSLRLFANLVFLSICLFSTRNVDASYPDYRFETIQVNGEAFDLAVKAIITDRHGFIWLATTKGLMRYDGYSVKEFRYDPNDQNSISSNFTTSILEDTNGMLWVGTAGSGLNRFDPTTEISVRFKPIEDDSSSLSHNDVEHIYEDSQGTIWVSTSGGGLNRYDAKGNRFKRYLPDKNNPLSISHSYVRKIIEDPSGNLWIATNNGLNYFYRDEERFIHFVHNKAIPSSLSNSIVRDIFYDKKGNLWIATSNGLNRFISFNEGFVHYYPNERDKHRRVDDNVISSIYEDKLDRLWLGTKGGGVKVFNRQNKTFWHYRNEPNRPYSLAHNKIKKYGFYEDSQGLLWILTGSGLNRVNPMASTFNHHRYASHHDGGLIGNRVWAIFEDEQERLWIGTDKQGINILDPVSQKFTQLKHDPSQPNGLNSNRIFSILVDKEETLWIATDKGLNKREKGQTDFTHYQHNPGDANTPNSNFIFELLEDHQGNIILGTDAGIAKYNKGTDKIERYNVSNRSQSVFDFVSLQELYEDKLGRLWVATTEGIIIFDANGNSVDLINKKPSSKYQLSDNDVHAIYESDDGYLWIGTRGGGLNRFDVETGEARYYREKDGLVDDVVLEIADDKQGNLWLATSNGLARFNIEQETFQHYSEIDGVYKRVGQWEGIQRKNGDIVLSGPDGFNLFNPAEINITSIAPKVSFTGMLLFNQQVPLKTTRPNDAPLQTDNNIHQTSVSNFKLEQPIHLTKAITLTHQESLVSFEFSALDYIEPKKNLYAYKLEGWDKHWIHTNYQNRRATYTNLPAGNYTLKVIGSNRHGVWNKQGASIDITVLPPIWKTWWAYILYWVSGLGIMSLIGYLIYHRRMSEKDKESALAIANAKEQLFANISHEFRTPLTLILGPVEQLAEHEESSRNKEKLNVIKRNGQRLLGLIDQILDLAKLRGEKDIERVPQEINETLKFICHSFESIAHANNIELTFSIKNDKQLWVNMVPDALLKLLLNIISNAFKYTEENGKIHCSIVTNNEQTVELMIEDTGCGISEEELPHIFDRFTRLKDTEQKVSGTGIGLALVKEIVDSHGGKVVVKSQLDVGSCFTITLPLYSYSGQHPLPEELRSTNYINEVVDTISLQELESYELDNFSDENNLPSVLIIDDNQDMRQYLTSVLSPFFSCTIAVDGKDGINKAEEIIPDVVISDLMMPKVNGYEVANHLKSNATTSHIPIVLLTAKGDKKDRIRGWQENIDEYLVKPFDPEELISRIKNLISIRELLQHRIKENTAGIVSMRNEPVPEDDEWISKEQQFIEKLDHFLVENMADSDLKVAAIAQALFVSERQLHRKLKALLNTTPSNYLRNYRLKKALELLKQGKGIGEVAGEVGFSSHSNFSRCFKVKYGYSPKQYAEMKTLETEN